MVFKNNNIQDKLPKNSPFQVGRADVDAPTPTVEQGVLLPWPTDPAQSWVYFDCAVGVMLDSGIVVHNRLPQVNRGYDTLSAKDLEDPNFSITTDVGVNLKCKDQYQDIVQRMGHARYWFRLWGQALRIGHKVPIPGISSVGGVAVVPYDKNPQWAFNRVFPGGNYSGVILWHARWSLWYTTLVPPTNNDIPAVDIAAHIDGRIPLAKGMQAPFSTVDDNAFPSKPGVRRPPTQLPTAVGGNNGGGGRLPVVE